MTEQKFILDATCGFRMMWVNKHDPNTLYLDNRAEVEPDQLGDFRHLDYADETFRLIVFDPPHLIRNSPSTGGDLLMQFGCLRPSTWESDLKQGFNELWRVLKPYGILIFKWNNGSLSSDKVISLAPEKPLFYQVSSSKPNTKDKNNRIKTLWFCFMKKPVFLMGGKEKP